MGCRFRLGGDGLGCGFSADAIICFRFSKAGGSGSFGGGVGPGFRADGGRGMGQRFSAGGGLFGIEDQGFGRHLLFASSFGGGDVGLGVWFRKAGLIGPCVDEGPGLRLSKGGGGPGCGVLTNELNSTSIN